MIYKNKKVYSFAIFESIKNGSKILEKINPGFVPHETFHKYSWLIPESSNWYYWTERKSPIEIPKNKSFYKTLDSPLKDSVIALHKKGIPTTPSCSGHFNPDSFYSKIFDSLKEEEKSIREGGIKLKDPESDHDFVYKDSGYMVPWDKNSFLEISKDHGRKGIIGILDPNEGIYKLLRETPNQDSQALREGNITFFVTNPKDQKSLNSSWEYFNDSIKRFID